MNWHDFVSHERASYDTIDFKKAYVDLADDLVAGLLLSQIIYWHLPGKNGRSKLQVRRDGKMWLAKKYDDWYEECRISAKQAQRAVAILRDRGLIEVGKFRFAGSPTVHVRINEQEFLNQWEALTGADLEDDDEDPDSVKWNMTKGHNPNQPKVTIQHDQRDETYTETTTQTTAETTKDRREKSAPTPKQTADHRGKAPAIQAARQVVGRYPPKELWDSIMETLGESPDMEKLTECRKEWVARGYNGNGWAWLLDWYKTGVPKRTGGVVASNKAKDVMAEWLAEQEDSESRGDRGATERSIRPVARKGNKGFTELVAGLAF